MTGLTHIYCGDGKGKTTAAIGLGIRACGRGKRVLLTQFLKGSDSGERNILEKIPGFTVTPNPDQIKFTFQMNEEELREAAEQCRERFAQAVGAAKQGECDLLILDEVFAACGAGLLAPEVVSDFIRHKPPELELVLTGRNPDPKIVELADYVSEMKKVKHPFDRNVPARKGVEF